jgi:hypothetical protein
MQSFLRLKPQLRSNVISLRQNRGMHLGRIVLQKDNPPPPESDETIVEMPTSQRKGRKPRDDAKDGRRVVHLDASIAEPLKDLIVQFTKEGFTEYLTLACTMKDAYLRRCVCVCVCDTLRLSLFI